MECNVEASISIPNIITINNENFEYTFYPSDKGKLEKIKITVPVQHPEKFYSKIGEGQPPAKFSINVDLDKEVYNKLIFEFQRIEATLTINGIKRIRWDSPRTTVIPETEEEREKIQVFSFEHNKEYPEREENFDNETLTDVIKTMHKYDELIVLRAFLREGINEFHRFNYINAFYNFYFILEDLYGGNNTKNSLVEKSFLASDELMNLLKDSLTKHIETNKKHKTNLTKFLKERQLDYSPENIIKLIISTRGSLHHFSRKNRLQQGTPLNQKDFETIAFLLFGLALTGVLFRIVDINKRDE